jgi:hypothetical protein
MAGLSSPVFSNKKPNILLMMGDDVDYWNLGHINPRG